ncbi:MAG TPA: hypothetical protein VGR86_07565 [Steroidobacteraceae bacterium]|nr:hypothetical protein [Steroidobacteraceae bacterium]
MIDDDRLRSGALDLAVPDVVSPELSGFEVLRGVDRVRQMPAIIASACDDEAQRGAVLRRTTREERSRNVCSFVGAWRRAISAPVAAHRRVAPNTRTTSHKC